MTEKNGQEIEAAELNDDQLDGAAGGTELVSIKAWKCKGCRREFEYHPHVAACPFCGSTSLEEQISYLIVQPYP